MKKRKATDNTLNPTQVEVVKEMIINSMVGAVESSGLPSNDSMVFAANNIADRIIKNVQHSLKTTWRLSLPVNFGKLKNMAKAKSPAKKAVKKVAKKKKK